MIDAYCNMSVPPQSKIQIVVRPIGKQVVFDLGRAGIRVPCDLGRPSQECDKSVREWLAGFVSQHKAELDAVPRPLGFMVGSLCEEINASLEDLMRSHPGVYHVCRDPILTIAVLGRMAGLIYIPQRELRLTDDSFDDTICFPAKYFPQLGLAS